jgi:hypothetical protein
MGCFGCAFIITDVFAVKLWIYHELETLLIGVKTRAMRCACERILSVCASQATSRKFTGLPSLCGDIFTAHQAFGYTFDAYQLEQKNGTLPRPKSSVDANGNTCEFFSIIKVWCGR